MLNEQTNSRKPIFGSWFALSKLDYGLEQAGLKTVWQVEYDDWCREVALPQNFPNTEKFRDVREVGKHNLRAVDVICGGFPCTDLSTAKLNAEGLEGARSGLWFEMFRIICELRPKFIVIENVSNLLNFGLDRVLSNLATIGYDAEWQTLRASTFGLPVRRKRLFIVAYPSSLRLEKILFKRGFNPGNEKQFDEFSRVFVEDLGHFYPQIPGHLRMDDGIAYEISEIKNAIKAYGNGVAVPVAKFIGEQIIRFDKEIKQAELFG